MTRLDHALALAAEGFHIFPLLPGAKTPPKGMTFKTLATRDEATIRAWFADGTANIGIFTGRFGDEGALLVVDVDKKKGKDGDASLLALELEGLELPDTREARTAGGGRHLFFRVPDAVGQSVDRLGTGLDIRSRGGYVVGAGSSTTAGDYAWVGDHAIASAPLWLVERCGVRNSAAAERAASTPVSVDPTRAASRARLFLERDAAIAVKGLGGDQTTYKVATQVKDMGVSQDDCVALMFEVWNPRCPPGWSYERLAEKVAHAYRYGRNAQGSAAPEADFTAVAEPAPEAPAKDVGHPYEELNKEYAFVLAGGGAHILWETTDADDRYKLEHLALSAFHQKHAASKISFGKKSVPVTEAWMEWDKRRSYDGLVFRPQIKAPDRFYNLWRGFAVEPLAATDQPTKEMQRGLDAFLEHARANVCGGDDSLYRWLCGYFAHLVQRPWEKPLVALVFRGSKGVGKNALVERVGHLLGGHFLLTSNRRYLVGNFNGHLENCLMFALDEAFWSGDKQAEGTIKDLVTGQNHVIEHKGKETYSVANVTRVVIIGNEEWLVPASHDERRYAVFNVGDGRKQDRAFFERMRTDMEAGGYRLLLRWLMDQPLADVNAAPVTQGLLDQKHATLEPHLEWWLSCLSEGRIVGGDFGEGWPETVERERFRNAFGRYARDRNIRGRLPDQRVLGKDMAKVLPAGASQRGSVNGVQTYTYRLGDLAACRAAWDAFIGHAVGWQS